MITRRTLFGSPLALLAGKASASTQRELKDMGPAELNKFLEEGTISINDVRRAFDLEPIR